MTVRRPPSADREFAIAAEILMSAEEFVAELVATILDVRAAADNYMVTLSAVVAWAMRLRMLAMDAGAVHRTRLEAEYRDLERGGPQQPKDVNAVRRHTGRDFSRRMMAARNAGRMSAGEFCRAVCLNKIKPAQIPDFRAAL